MKYPPEDNHRVVAVDVVVPVFELGAQEKEKGTTRMRARVRE